MDRSATAPNPIGPGRPTDGESSVGGVTNNQVTNNQKDRQALLEQLRRLARDPRAPGSDTAGNDTAAVVRDEGSGWKSVSGAAIDGQQGSQHRARGDVNPITHRDPHSGQGQGVIPTEHPPYTTARRRQRRRRPANEPPREAVEAGPGHESARAQRSGEREANPYEFARKVALRLLDRRDLTAGELTQRLLAKQVPPETAQQVVTRFLQVGLINDERYAEQFTAARQANRGLARRVVAQELRRKGIDPDVVEAATAVIDRDAERATAVELAQRRVQRLSGLPREVQYRRLGGFLARKGYDASLVHDVLQSVLEQHSSES